MQQQHTSTIKVNKRRDLIIFILFISVIIFGFTYWAYLIYTSPVISLYDKTFPIIKAALVEAVEELKNTGKIPIYDWSLMSKVLEVYTNAHAQNLTNRFVQNHIDWKSMIADIVTYPEILHFVIRRSIAALTKAGINDFYTASLIFDNLRIYFLENFDQLDKLCECIAEGLEQWTKDFNARPKFDSFKYPELRFMNDKWVIQNGKIDFLKNYVQANLHRFIVR
jgi:hypothetical protein